MFISNENDLSRKQFSIIEGKIAVDKSQEAKHYALI